jgi:IclR-like helix-turn-helix domain-containing protein
MAMTWRNATGGPIMHLPVEIDFWHELDAEVLHCLAERPGEVSPAQLGGRLGMSEAAVCSILAMLAETGKVRIRSVERIL